MPIKLTLNIADDTYGRPASQTMASYA